MIHLQASLFLYRIMYLFGSDLWRLHFILARFLSLSLSFFLAATFDYSSVNSASVHCSRVPQTSLFSYFFIKNGFHDTIHTFRNYFVTIFSIFNKNKLYPNEPYIGVSKAFGGMAPSLCVPPPLTAYLFIFVYQATTNFHRSNDIFTLSFLYSLLCFKMLIFSHWILICKLE